MSLTLFSITNIQHDITAFSLNKTRSCVPATKTLLISDQKPCGDTTIGWLPIAQNFGMLEYCNFCLKEMHSVIDTDFVLICHYDGMATNPQYWTDEYLEYDYVGSLSHVNYHPMKNSLQLSGFYEQHKHKPWFTCGGGLSLRSKRLLNILANDPQIKTLNFQPNYAEPFISEDAVITLLNKEYLEKAYGIKFAPLHLAMQFCAEVLTGYNYAMGFHGWHNAPLFLTEEECLFYFPLFNKSGYHQMSAQMQICKHHIMMQGYFRLRDYMISENKWLIY